MMPKFRDYGLIVVVVEVEEPNYLFSFYFLFFDNSIFTTRCTSGMVVK